MKKIILKIQKENKYGSIKELNKNVEKLLESFNINEDDKSLEPGDFVNLNIVYINDNLYELR